MHKLSALLILFTLAPIHAQTLVGVTGDGGLTPESLFTIDPSDASSVFLMALGNGDDGETIAFNPDDDLLYHASGKLARVWESIDASTPAIVATGPFTSNGAVNENSAMTHDPVTGRFLVSDHSSQLLDTTTAGVGTLIGTVPEKLKGLAFSNGVLYGTAQVGGELYQLDPDDGSVVSTTNMTFQSIGLDGTNGLATHPDTGQLWLVFRYNTTLDRHLGVVDPSNGVVTSVGVLNELFAGIAFLPEPSTATGLAAGIAALFTLTRRRRRER